MIRRVSTVAFALSLMLCLATLAGWLVSLCLYGNLRINVRHPAFVLMIDYRDGIELSATWPVVQNSVEFDAFGGGYESWISLGEAHVGAFGIGRRRSVPIEGGSGGRIYATQTGETIFSRCPKWFPFAAGIASALFWWRSRRRAFAATGLCPACGYDLRASRNRCPECGRIVPISNRRPDE